ncbi:hypothetical protein [Legionella saoudiensis]|uniref:hypothetical protein n=1 Tax=Legionella saoudiensis TaxID=1750561 RepID=UPI000730739D|nr:hypothetical protein [Legionella saoudiensis]
MDGYFLCVDILGFSEIVKNLSKVKSKNKIKEWVDLVRTSAQTNNIKNYQLLSDTVFASVLNKDELGNLISFARTLLEKGIEKSIPIRGGISYGSFEWSDILIYGPAVIEAHIIEQEQQWIGISFSPKIQLNEKVLDEHNLVVYPTPKTNGYIQLHTVIAWSVPKYSLLSGYLTSSGLGGIPGKGKNLDWNFGYKIQNTIIFGIYLEFLNKTGDTAFKYHGHNPIQFLDEHYRGR